MGYFDKWYSWLFTPLSSALYKIGSGVDSAVRSYTSDENRADLSFTDDSWNELINPYSDLIQSLRDSGYGDLVDSTLSQWKGSYFSYNPGILDKLGSDFGARTGQTKYSEYIAAQLGEALNGISQQRQQNEFNSPLAQSSRERQAGINSDLLGIGDVAGAAQPAEDTNNVLPDTAALSLENLQSYGQFLFSLPSLIMGISRDARSLKSIKLANEGQEIANDQAQVGFLGDLFSNVKSGIIGAVDENDVDLGVGDDPIVQEQTIHRQLSLAKDRFLRTIKVSVSPKLFKSISKAADEYFGSMDYATEVNERRTRYFGAKVDKTRKRQSKFVGGNEHGYDDVLDVLNKGMTDLIDLKDEYGMSLMAWSNRNQAEYQQQFNSLGGPSITAANDIQSSTYGSQSLGLDVELKRLQKKMTEAQEQMVYDLKNLADSGNTWARVALYLINAFRIAK